MSPLRYLSRFENAAGTVSVVFPTHRYEWEQSQPLLASTAQLTGASYGFDQLGGAPAVKGNGVERVRFLDVGEADELDDDNDRFKAMMSWGRGKAWTTGAAGNRWAWARLAEMPSLSFTVDNLRHEPVLLLFERFSDWYEADAIGAAGEFSISTDPQTIVVTNPGNAPVRNAIITIKGPTAGGNPKITNNSAFLPGTTTPYVLEFDNDLPTDAWYRIDCGRNTAEVTFDAGLTWDPVGPDVGASLVRADGQVALMVFEAGVNSLVCDDCDGGEVIVELSGAWH